MISYLDALVKKNGEGSFVSCFDVSKQFLEELPDKNMGTRFTPCCMLRLFADLLTEIPDKILYLDTDVICRRDFTPFYSQDITNFEFVGVLDYYGSWFFRKKWYKRDYCNSGVLLFNMEKIRQTNLFGKCRKACMEKNMFMPDQSALNNLAVAKGIDKRKYNDQRRLRNDTVLQHFTTTFRFFPWFHTVTVKPWQIDKMHTVLKLHEYDALLDEFIIRKTDMNQEELCS
jgi:lipopolysaccharide biosynthesis glycosyltransferase